MSDQDSEQLAAREAGRDAAIVLSAADRVYFGTRREAVLKVAFTAIDAGELTPLQAFQVVVQLREYDRVLKGFQKLVRDAEKASAEIFSSKAQSE